MLIKSTTRTLSVVLVTASLVGCASTAHDHESNFDLQPGFARLAFEEPNRRPNVFKEKLFGNIAELKSQTGASAASEDSSKFSKKGKGYFGFVMERSVCFCAGRGRYRPIYTSPISKALPSKSQSKNSSAQSKKSAPLFMKCSMQDAKTIIQLVAKLWKTFSAFLHDLCRNMTRLLL